MVNYANDEMPKMLFAASSGNIFVSSQQLLEHVEENKDDISNLYNLYLCKLQMYLLNI